MKRFSERIIDVVTKWLKNRDWEEIVGYLISGVISIAIIITLFHQMTDRTSTTSDDYKQLINDIQENPELLLKNDCDIHIRDGRIIVEFENEECQMRAVYDENFEVVSTDEQDKSIFWKIILVVVCIILMYVLPEIIIILILFLELFVGVLIFDPIKDYFKRNKS